MLPFWDSLLIQSVWLCTLRPARDAAGIAEHAISENVANLMLEMYQAVDSGKLRPIQPRTDETTTPTTLLEFAHEVLLPMMATAVAH